MRYYNLVPRKILLILIAIVFVALLASCFHSQSVSEVDQEVAKTNSVCDEILKGEELEPVKKFEGAPAPVNFSSFPAATMFSSVITESTAKGANFAGHYTFTSWGCGTNCMQYAITDSKTGNIVVYHDEPVEFSAYPPKYDINSRLLVFNPKDSLNKLNGKSVEQIIKEYGHEAGLERAYYVIEDEHDDVPTILNKICSENVLDGLISRN